MIRFATIGTSWITGSFVDGVKLHGAMEYAAVYSRNAEKGAEFAAKYAAPNWSPRIVTDLDELAADPDVDAVYIASPNYYHYYQSKKMLEAGKHVICEKPITVVPEQLIELRDLAASKKLVYMEALMARHMPEWNLILEMLPKIGKISHARFDFSQRSTRYDSTMAGKKENIFDPMMAAGCLEDLGVYCVYPAAAFFGLPESVDAWASFLKLPNGEKLADGAGGATLRYPGFAVELVYSKTGQSAVGSEIVGDEGTLVLPSISKLTNAKLVDKSGKETILTGDFEKAEMMRFESLDFARYIRQYDETACERAKLDELALNVSRIMQEIRQKAGIVLREY